MPPSLKDIYGLIGASLKPDSGKSAQITAEEAIETFVDQRSGNGSSPWEGASVDKFNQDIWNLYSSEVGPVPIGVVSAASDVGQYYDRVSLLLRLLERIMPVIGPTRLVATWWTPVLKPILQDPRFPRSLREQCRSILIKLLIDENDPNSTKFRQDILELYLQKRHRNPTATEQGKEQTVSIAQDMSTESDETLPPHRALLDLDEDVWYQNLASVLVELGGWRTKDFFVLLNSYFVQSRYRLQTLHLLTEFISKKASDRTHVYDMLETPLFQSILTSLMLDHSTTLIAISVSNLIMLLPRICTALPEHLPKLFYIYARAICWDQIRHRSQERHATRQSIVTLDAGDTHSPPPSSNDQNANSNETQANSEQQANEPPNSGNSMGAAYEGWDLLDFSVSKVSAPPSNPRAGPLFTCLYGLFPCNFMAFLHSPEAYFANKNFNPPEEIVDDVFKKRAMVSVDRHMLHPMLLRMDASSELTNLDRFQVEPPVIMAACMSLDMTNTPSRVVMPQTVNQASDHQLSSVESLWNVLAAVTSDDMVAPVTDDTTYNLEKTVADNATKSSEDRILDTHKALVTEESSDTLDDLSRTADSLDAVKPAAGAQVYSSPEGNVDSMLATLRREVLLLRNELNFELFLRQQHIQHIKLLHQERLKMETSLASAEEMGSAARDLMVQLESANEKYKALQTYSQRQDRQRTLRSKGVSNKAEILREEKKALVAENKELKDELQATKVRIKDQDEVLAALRKKEFDLEAKIAIMEPEIERLRTAEGHIERMAEQMIRWEEDMTKKKDEHRKMDALLSQLAGTEGQVKALEVENAQLKGELEIHSADADRLRVQISELQQQAMTRTKAVREPSENPPPNTEDSNHAKNEAKRLLERNLELETKLVDLQAELESRAEEARYGSMSSTPSSFQPDGHVQSPAQSVHSDSSKYLARAEHVAIPRGPSTSTLLSSDQKSKTRRTSHSFMENRLSREMSAGLDSLFHHDTRTEKKTEADKERKGKEKRSFLHL